MAKFIFENGKIHSQLGHLHSEFVVYDQNPFEDFLEMESGLTIFQANLKTLSVIFASTMPFVGLTTSVFVIFILFYQKRSNDHSLHLLLYLFKWQYCAILAYSINMLLNDIQVMNFVFGYDLDIMLTSAVCKLRMILMRFIYCLSPWLQVVITFDRVWAVYLKDKIKIRRSKKSLTILILLVVAVVFLSTLINIDADVHQFGRIIPVFNSSLNKTEQIKTVFLKCFSTNKQLKLAQDLVYLIMRVLVPFVIMIGCSILLVVHVNTARRSSVVMRMIMWSRHNRRKKKLTLAVCFVNVSFVLLNLSYVLAIVLSKLAINLNHDIFRERLAVFYGPSVWLSYSFTLVQFWFDFVFNRLFRKVIVQTTGSLFRRACLKNNESTVNTNSN